MSHDEILKRAIQKALNNGWSWPFDKDYLKFNFVVTDGMPILWNGLEYEDASTLNSEAVIFNHDFARALWGDKNIYITGDEIGEGWVALLHPTIERYKYHLQQMVVSPDPIRYIGNSIQSNTV